MKTLLKIFGGVIGVVVVLAVVAAVVVPMVVDPNDYKDTIASAVKDKTGRVLDIQGDIELAVLPNVRLELGAVQLGNAPGFPQPYFARLNDMRVRLKIMPLLLERKVEVNTITLNGLSVILARNDKGVTNWSDLVPANNNHPAGMEKPGADGNANLAALAIGGLDLRGADLQWDDAMAGRQVKVQNLSVQTGALAIDKPLALELDFDVEGLVPGVTGHVKTAAVVSADLANGQYKASGLSLEAKLQGEAMPGGEGTVTVGAKEGVFDVASQKVAVQGLSLETTPLGFGEWRGSATAGGDLQGDLGAQLFEIAGLKLKSAISRSGDKPDKVSVALSGNARADLNGQTVAVTGMQATVSDLAMAGVTGQIQASGDVGGSLAEQRYSIGKLDAKGNLAGEALGGNSLVFDLVSAVGADLAAQRFTVTGLSMQGTVTGEAMPGGKLPFSLAGDVDFDQAKEALGVKGLKIDAAEVQATADLDIAKALSAPAVSGRIEVPKVNPRTLLALAGQKAPATADPKALTSASLSTRLAVSGNSVKLSPFSLRLDGSKIDGTVDVKDVTTQAIAFDLGVDSLDVDRYLPPKPAGGAAAAKPAATPGAAAGAAFELPVEMLRGLDIDGRLKVGNLVASGMRLTGVDVGVKAKGGLVQTAPLKASLYGGSYDGSIVLDARSAQATLTVDEKVQGLRGDALLKDLGVAPGLDLSGGASSLHFKAKASGDPAKQAYKVSGLDLSADLAGKSFPNGRAKFNLATDADIDLAKQTLVARNVALEYAGAKAAANFDVSKLLDAPQFSGDLALAMFNPRTLLAALGQPAPVTADPKALTQAELKASLGGSTTGIELKSLAARVDETKLTGTLNVQNFAAPSVRFDLKVDQIDADRYLPPQKDKKAATPGAAAALVPVETVRGLDVDGKLEIGRLKISNLKLSNIVVTAKAKDGLVNLHPLGAKLYQGTYTGNVRIDARGKLPTLTIDEKLSQIQAGPLIKDLKGTDVLRGVADLDAKLTATGNDEVAIKKSLDGKANFAFHDGAVKGFDIAHLICDTLGKMSFASGKPQDLIAGVLGAMGASQAKNSGDAAKGETRFAALSGTLWVKNGGMWNEDLDLRSPLVRVGGKGSYNFLSEKIDYLANATVVSSCEGQGGRAAADLKGLTIPVKVGGTSAKPTYEPQLDKVMAQLGTRRATGTNTTAAPAPAAKPAPVPAKPEDALKKAGEDLLKKGLKGIFGN